MNKAEYLKELEKRLKYIPKEDREDALEYYTELISDMELDDAADVIEKLGTPKDVAKKIVDECGEKAEQAYEENKTVKGHATVVWLSILGALSLPLSLPLAIVVLALAFSLIVVIVSILLTLAVTAFALVVGGVGSLVVMWAAPGIAQKLVILGMGLVSLAFGVLMGIGVFYLTRLIIRGLFRRNRKDKKETE
ncbi:MAG: DUF1700 domain-containing protein [Lachnospiraceae bacterium]|nr:DUF1700 domain-containing protein [Lachnospiraceae bacterium]